MWGIHITPMDATDAIIYLAQQEGAKYRFCTSEEDISKEIPYFEIFRDGLGNYDVRGFAYAGHDNAPRMDFLCRYLKNNVFQHINPSTNLCGFYNIELHDSYSYLNNGKDYDNVLTFSKHRDHARPILLPDVYHMADYGGLLSVQDTLTWEQKRNKIGFFGTTTGDRDPRRNLRIQVCQWGLQHRDITDFFITRVAQMTPETVLREVPDFSQIYRPPVPETEQFKYKFLLDVKGNTCCWNRLPMILNSKSLCFHMPCADMCFYYPLLRAKTHYVRTHLHELASMYQYYLNHPREVEFMVQSANQFVKQTLSGNHALLYTVHLFESMADKRA